MIAIQKGSEPEGLRRLRQQAAAKGLSPKEAYDSLKNPLKEQVKDKLIAEQGQLCAYCMCKIPRSDVKFDLIHTLNLNCSSAPLVAERKSALESLINEINQVPENEQIEYCAAALEAFYTESNPKTPYVGVLTWYLQSLLFALNQF